MRPNDRFLSRRLFGAGLLATGTGLSASPALVQTLAQTDPPLTPESPVGPFYPLTHPADHDADLVWLKGRSQKAAGSVIQVSGRILDSRGRPIRNAVIELWQANAAGRYDHPNDVAKSPLDPNFQGFARLVTGSDGGWRITTVKPAAYDSPIGRRTPHIHFDVRGHAHRLTAQMYFSDDAAQNTVDPLYGNLGADGPRSVARLEAPSRYQWDVVLMDA
ncbi:protocatechuate 3,4-dioxygenase [Phenylobacterium sp. SCN 70-31]|uniref:protocatechuate 3,4-dioxygenase n=1 Tax=Phenylobacterium sp. SCN 70-31 TaxID=1660129 RepID=UPI000AF858B6|nr:protocatechuate 3,4-dioxygenase [Phenylobacterium sp. SCN 70-31]